MKRLAFMLQNNWSNRQHTLTKAAWIQKEKVKTVYDELHYLYSTPNIGT